MDLLPAETSSFPSPIPTQFVASDEFTPAPQTEKQKQVEARIYEREGPGRTNLRYGFVVNPVG